MELAFTEMEKSRGRADWRNKCREENKNCYLEMSEMPTGHIPNWKSEEKPRVMIKSLEIQPIDGI